MTDIEYFRGTSRFTPQAEIEAFRKHIRDNPSYFDFTEEEEVLYFMMYGMSKTDYIDEYYAVLKHF